MKGFIEILIEENDRDTKLLVNVNHIISVKELIIGNSNLSELRIIGNMNTFDIQAQQSHPTVYYVNQELENIIVFHSFEEIKTMIENAL
jgi:hypothetical protein